MGILHLKRFVVLDDHGLALLCLLGLEVGLGVLGLVLVHGLLVGGYCGLIDGDPLLVQLYLLLVRSDCLGVDLCKLSDFGLEQVVETLDLEVELGCLLDSFQRMAHCVQDGGFLRLGVHELPFEIYDIPLMLLYLLLLLLDVLP